MSLYIISLKFAMLNEDLLYFILFLSFFLPLSMYSFLINTANQRKKKFCEVKFDGRESRSSEIIQRTFHILKFSKIPFFSGVQQKELTVVRTLANLKIFCKSPSKESTSREYNDLLLLGTPTQSEIWKLLLFVIRMKATNSLFFKKQNKNQKQRLGSLQQAYLLQFRSICLPIKCYFSQM